MSLERRAAAIVSLVTTLLAIVCRTVVVRPAAAALIAIFAIGASSGIANAQSAGLAVTVYGKVTTADGKAVASATVTLIGPERLSTTTDASGAFTLPQVTTGTYELVATSNKYGTASRSNVDISTDIDVAIQYSVEQGGPRIIGRVSTMSTASINITAAASTTKSPDDLELQGQMSLRQVLQEVPGVAIGNSTGDTVSMIAGSPLSPEVISIRGTLPYETATLLDGMPLYLTSWGSDGPGGGTDLAQYNANAFSSYDVLRGPGAASPSIIDSIGGSLLLRSPGLVTKNHLDLSTSTDPYGGSIETVSGGIHVGRLSASASYQVNDSPGPISSPSFEGDYFGSDIYQINGNTFDCDSACGPHLVPPTTTTREPTIIQTGTIGCCAPASSHWTSHSGYASLHYDISPTVSAQVFYTGQATNMNQAYGGATDIFTPPPGYVGSLPAGTYNFLYFDYTPALFEQMSSLLEEKIVAGIGPGELTIAELQNRTAYSISEGYGYPATSQMQLFGGGAYYTAGGGTTPVIFNGGTYSVSLTPNSFNRAVFTDNRDALVSYEAALGPATRVGASYVQSYYNNPSFYSGAGGYVSGGTLQSFSFSGAQSGALDEQTDEFRIAVGSTPTARTSIDLSWYFVGVAYHLKNPNVPTLSTYVNSNFAYSAPRLGFVWRPESELALRVSAGGGIAAAPLSNMIGTNGTPLASGPSGAPTSYTETLTNINLQPEKSATLDLGADLRLQHDSVASFDVFGSNLYGQQFLSQYQDGLYNNVPLYVAEYRNLGQSRYAGIELEVKHDVTRGWIWDASGSLNRGYVVSVPPGFYNTAAGPDTTNLNVVPGENFNGTFTAAAVPYSQAFASFGYRWSKERFVALDSEYYGPNNSYYQPAFVVLNANASIALTRNLSLQGTVRNITGIYDNPVNSYGTAMAFPTVSGLPQGVNQSNYGPRTFILTGRLQL